jgi:hypothetical protein
LDDDDDAAKGATNGDQLEEDQNKGFDEDADDGDDVDGDEENFRRMKRLAELR